MSAWTVILLFMCCVTAGILINAYLTSLIMDTYHKSNVEPMQEELEDLREQLYAKGG